MSTSDPTGDSDGTSGSTSGETGGTTGATTDVTGESSGSGSSGESGSGSSTGATVDDCDACGANEVCVENQAQIVTYECRPLPDACDGDVDCECGMELCEDPFVACNDQPDPMHLACICIAC
jgi:hypothetical protein